ncbi:MAG: XRE family transcriptional regulator [Puniceicoccaceae bacterium]|nr:MAG: XRE family transcriptional regulator [Puniceicoccaceae bacterium]
MSCSIMSCTILSMFAQPTYASVLRAARERCGLSMRQLAAQADLDQGALSKFENGHRLPSEEQLRRLAGVCDVDDDEVDYWLALRAVSEFQQKYQHAGYYNSCVGILSESAGAYNQPLDHSRAPDGSDASGNFGNSDPCE